ncbi:MAG: glycerophosphodiester phosphodiesterase [Caldilineaceae bacterium]|nr:glycerophosphodiester phosphodiesterase [Caldilineaceae bacterium]
MFANLDLRDFVEVREARLAHGTPFVIAHRGASAVAPENTMHAFALAIDQGACLIETDLWFSKDRELILLHDRNLQRTTGRNAYVTDLSAAEVVSTPVNMQERDAPEPQFVPPLAALLELASKANVALLLELKDPRFSIPSWARKLIDVLGTHEFLSHVLVTSFQPRCLLAIREVYPELPVGPVAMNMLFPAPDWDFVGPAWPNLAANPLFVWHAHRERMLVAPLDTDPTTRMSMYARQGVDAVLTDDVAATVAALPAAAGQPGRRHGLA